MDHGYDAVLRGDTLEWTGERPSELERTKPIPVRITTREETPQIPEDERGQEIYNLLNQIAARQTPESTQAWIEYMEEMRKDKPLYGREED